jgi:xanthine/uracil/vitamin C permease (AzgA family)
MLALAVAQAVIALKGHRLVALGWLMSMGTFLAVTALVSNDLYLRVELGLVSGSGCALVVFALALKRSLAQDVVPDPELMAEGILDLPLGE